MNLVFAVFIIALLVVGVVALQRRAARLSREQAAQQQIDRENGERERRAMERRELEKQGRQNASHVTPKLCITFCTELCHEEGLTTYQGERRFIEECRGKWVMWTLKVADVDHPFIYLRDPSMAQPHDVVVDFSGSSGIDPSVLEASRKLRKGSSTTICGKVVDVSQHSDHPGPIIWLESSWFTSAQP